MTRIGGVVVLNKSDTKFDVSEPFFLRIESVNGVKVAEPVVYRFRKHHFHGELTEPQIGDRFDFVGYETGRYQGIVGGQLEYTPSYADIGFSFLTEFIVLADAAAHTGGPEHARFDD